MRIFGMGPTELLIIAVILLIAIVPSLLAVVGMYKVTRKAGYDSGAATLWSMAFLVFGGLAVLALGLLDWPRDRHVEQPVVEDAVAPA